MEAGDEVKSQNCTEYVCEPDQGGLVVKTLSTAYSFIIRECYFIANIHRTCLWSNINFKYKTKMNANAILLETYMSKLQLNNLELRIF